MSESAAEPVESIERVLPQIPVPRGPAFPRPRVFQRLVLEPRRVQAQGTADGQQPLPIGAHQMRHALAPDAVPVKPDAAVEGEAHPLAAARELPAGVRY